MALVVLLAFLVLLAGLILAFFSRATETRRTSATSSSAAVADLLVRSAVETIVNDFQLEIQAGSAPDPLEDFPVAVWIPQLEVWQGQGMSYAPSARAQIQRPDWPLNLVKLSKAGVAFHAGAGQEDDAQPAGAARAATAATTAAGVGGRRIPDRRWAAPGLAAAGEWGGPDDPVIPGPDWIYVDRAGRNPTAFATEDLRRMANPAPGNPGHVVGRFAYSVYEVGGLLDIGLAGNRLGDPAWDATRSGLHHVSLTPTGGGEAPLPPRFQTFSSLVNWRMAEPLQDPDLEKRMLEDSAGGGFGIGEGRQGFLGRRDLLDYSARVQDPLLEQALPFLTTFSRASNAPVYAPDPQARQFRSELFADTANHDFKPFPPLGSPPGNVHPLSSPDPAELNPALLSARFTEDVVLSRPEGSLEVPAGTPVMFRRFPLSKLSLFEQAPSAEELLYYFGLEKQGAGYRYAAGVEDPPDSGRYRIARLQEVADQGREPNFFEVLQAVILTGSLGKSAGPRTDTWHNNLDNTVTTSHLTDSLRNIQAIQIGANLIDQWDADDLPTIIEFPSATEGRFVEIFGTESLPYINQVVLQTYRPTYDPDRFQFWMLFNVWNPHRNAQAPGGISQFRVVPRAGSASALKGLLPYHPTPGATYTPIWNATGYQKRVPVGMTGAGTSWPVTTVHGDRQFVFPAAAYSEPTMVGGGEPQSAADTPGILLIDWNLSEAADNSGPRPNPAIPAKHERPGSLQRLINEWYDLLDNPDTEANEVGFPYRAISAEGATIRNGQNLNPDLEHLEGLTAGGERTYPVGTSFEIPPGHRQYWVFNPPLRFTPTEETPNPTRSDPVEQITTVYGEMAAKAHNFFRYYPISTDPLLLELQALVEGEQGGWRTIQKIEGWHAWMHSSMSAADMLHHPSYLRTHQPTHHTAFSGFEDFRNSPMYSRAFYPWRWREVNLKMDPRSNRFGFSADIYTPPGTSLRRTREAWNGAWSAAIFNPPDGSPPKWFTMRSGMRKVGYNNITHVTPAEIPRGAAPGFEFRYWIDATWPFVTPYGMMSNHPTRLDAEHPMRYADIDGIVRPADGVWGAIPSIPDNHAERPPILNRPFRSVGEMGLAFRDMPWKSLDFANPQSGDLGLLDAFSLEDSPDAPALMAGRVNLNTRRPEILEAILTGAGKQPDQDQPTTLSREEARLIAGAIVAESAQRPFFHPGELVARVLGSSAADAPVQGIIKQEREAAIRALAALGSCATWNFLIDVIAQSGNFMPHAGGADDFMVRAESRAWVHVAIDRATGRVVDLQWEAIHE